MRKPYFLFVLFLSLSLLLWGEQDCLLKPDQTVMVQMRDGKELSIDLYFPPAYHEGTQKEGFPCLLVRSPAGKTSGPALSTLQHLKEGYLMAIQETRSAADPEGKTMPCLDDGWGTFKDGYDTVDWLSKNPVTNGKIGTLGPSALGISQLMLAPTNPPGLVAQYIPFACGSIFHDAAFPQGQLHKDQIEGWLSFYAKDPCHIQTIRSHRNYSQFWNLFDSTSRACEVKVPALFVAGWFDTFLQGTIKAFQARQHFGGEGAKGEQKLIIGPWAHFWPFVRTIGDYDVPKEGINPPNQLTSQEWFAYYLKGENNGINELPAITYYVMGPFDGSPSKGNRWKSSKTWPVESKKKAFYLSPDQKLSLKPSKTFKEFEYSYDPENPCPTLGGNNLFLESGPKDQRPVESRDDMLIFTSEVLTNDLEITGDVVAKIYFTTDSDDTDLSVRLTDVYPDEKSVLITDHQIRLASLYQDAISVADKNVKVPHEVTLYLNPTSIVFAKGHKIRVSLTSSNYPRFEKNLNVRMDVEGKSLSPPQKANNKILVGDRYPSRIILPIIE